ncbi:putative Cytochrome P450 2J2-like protein [Naja naja]|nr:putative Cytochrome P450 2J2-like protein [Naja naja]
MLIGLFLNDSHIDSSGIALANGHTWKQQRHFTVSGLRLLGLGKPDMERQLEEEAHRFPIDPLSPINNSVCSMICLFSLGYCFSPEDTKFQMIIDDVSNYMKFGGSTFLLLYELFPWLVKHLPGPHQKIEASVQKGISLIREETEKHSQDLALHKVYKEMETVLGSSDSICYEDRWKLPYTHAVFHEILRSKYGTLIIADFHSVLLDPKQWESPEEFNPNHFLDKEGKFMKREEFLAFGAGSRVCLGENLARTEIFLLLTNLLRSFKLQLPEGVKELNQEPVVGISLHPQPFKLCAVPRCRSS